ncbi:MAG: methylated-DNA--[protein]-cysteine S-methyltransferase [Rhodocyclaceae bacterium]|nr:methylated-DNA--[protein]-cysteine S-methyltransferase [Rhodocyclaceae bacterium]
MGAFDLVMAAPFGALGVSTDGDRLTRIVFLPPGTPTAPASTAYAEQVRREIAAYLADPDHVFQLSIEAAGTPHQQRVWAAMRRIPRGHVRRYGDLAAELGSAARAVGQACGANPCPVVVPCHRVVAASGPGGFANARDGYLLDTKLWLLRHEGAML